MWSGTLVLLVFLLSGYNFSSFKTNVLKDKYLWIVIIISVLIRLLFIDKYPFILISDELRDTGADAWALLNSNITNIFGYGMYASHGLIIPTLATPFAAIFQESRYAIVLPAAFFGVIDVFVIYQLTKKFINKQTALITSLCLSLNPLHLYYSRTQLVVMMSSLLTTIGLYCLFNFLKNKSWKSFLITAIICGFSFNFHHSIKPVSILISLIVIGYAIRLILQKKLKLKFLFIWILIFIVSFGPRLMFTNAYTFFGLSRLPIANNEIFNIQDYFNNYLNSLKVIDQQSTVLFFAEHVPLLPFGSVLLMIFGLAIAFLKKTFRSSFMLILVVLVLTIFFTNSAITDRINHDHRLAPLLPILSLIFGFACYTIWSFIKKKSHFLASTFLVIVAFVYLAGPLNFFTSGWANRSMHQSNPEMSYRDFQIHYSIEAIKNEPFESICIYGSYDFFPMFVMEYYFPKKEISYQQEETIPEDTIKFVLDCNTNPSFYSRKQYCTNSDKLVCPEDGKSFFIDYYKHE